MRPNKKYLFLLLILLTLSPPLLHANGEPVDGSNIWGTGNLQALQKKDIDLNEELIKIELDGDFANVEVDYLFINKGKSEKITYGFPVDINTQSVYFNRNVTDCFPSFKIEDEQGPLVFQEKYYEIPDDPEEKAKLPKTIRNWYLTEINFPSGKKKLHISYRIRNSFEDWFTSKSVFTETSPRTFFYSLSPSKHWGNGIVKKFKVIFDPRNAEVNQGVIILNYNLDFKKDSQGLFVFETANYNLASAKNIEIAYSNSVAIYSGTLHNDRSWVERITDIQSSSILKGSYSLENLYDNDLNTAWVEGSAGNGEKEWVEIELKYYRIRWIGIISGYTKSEKTYYENNRIKKLLLEITPGPTEEKKEVYRKTIQFEDKTYTFNNRKFLFNLVTKVFNDYLDASAYRIRFTILEVYPGTVYKDTCISEIYILGYPED